MKRTFDEVGSPHSSQRPLDFGGRFAAGDFSDSNAYPYDQVKTEAVVKSEGYPQSARLDFVPWVMMVPSALTGAIFGVRGNKIRELQNLTGATIDVEKPNATTQTPDKIVTIHGDLDQKTHACRLTLTAVFEESMVRNGIPSDTLHTYHSEMSFFMPPRSVRLIIGTKGAHIKSLESDSGAVVDLSRDPEKQGLCTIKGNLTQIVTAARKIYEVVATDKLTGGSCVFTQQVPDVRPAHHYPSSSYPAPRPPVPAYDPVYPRYASPQFAPHPSYAPQVHLTPNTTPIHASAYRAVPAYPQHPPQQPYLPVLPNGQPDYYAYFAGLDRATAIDILLRITSDKERPAPVPLTGLGDHIRWNLLLPGTMIPTIIGPNGDVFREIQSKSGAHVDLPPLDEPLAGEKLIVFRGSDTAKGTAMYMILQHLGLTSDTTARFQIPAASLNKLVGQNGDGIEVLSQKCKNKVCVAPESVDKEMKILVLQGNVPSIIQAARMVFPLCL